MGAVYDEEMDEDEIAEAASRVARRVLPTVTAAQLAQQQLALGFYRAYSITELGRTLETLPAVDIAGHRVGQSLLEGMAPLGSMMLGAIARGEPLPGVLEYGRTLFERFGDATARQAADVEKANQDSRPEVVGWEGIIDDGACDLCQANAGPHDLADELYRHGSCMCERVPLLGAAGS